MSMVPQMSAGAATPMSQLRVPSGPVARKLLQGAPSDLLHQTAGLPLGVLHQLSTVAGLAHAVGLRPVRKDGVRLELEDARPGPVVHCYGHGGCGVTLMWGCAADVTRLVGRRLLLSHGKL
jgi:hypothetical protein